MSNLFNMRVINAQYIILLASATEVIHEYEEHGQVSPETVEFLENIIKGVRAETPTVLLEAASAIRARKDEEWSHPALIKFGQMSADVDADVNAIIHRASVQATTEALRLAEETWAKMSPLEKIRARIDAEEKP